MAREYVLQPFRSPVDLRIDYAGELNPQQLAAVTAPSGPSLVIAGAGAGKTRTLTYRVAYLIERGVPADRILLLTFTNKAAREMMRRVAELLSGELSSLWGGTFHSIGHRLLRRHAELVNYRPDFTILDSEDARHLLKACLSDAGLDTKAKPFPKAEVLGAIFSLAINTRQTVTQLIQGQYDHFVELSAPIEDLFRRYQARKRAGNVMDFDDLLELWWELMRPESAVRDRYQRQFQYVLVDEYQDTNQLQSDLIDCLVAGHHNVMAVGDDAQSIYAWRGANFRNILQFPSRYPEARIYKIETNYRSVPEVLEVANRAIAPNVNQFKKDLVAVRLSGAKPALVVCGDAYEQAAFVSQRAMELRDEGVPLNRMAVLYRSHFHAMELQMELTQRQIPFIITSGVRFFEQAHIKDLTAYLKWVGNPQDELAFKRLAQLLPGIGAKGAEKIWRLCPHTGLAPAARLESCQSAVPKKAQSAWRQLIATMAQLETDGLREHPDQMVTLVLAAGYEDYLKATYENYRSRLEDLRQLAVFSTQFPSLRDFLAQLSLLSNVEAEDQSPGNRAEERLWLSSIHQAKGLEFDVVFVIMLCDGLFPSGHATEDLERLEEERRLFYVAITRARNLLYLSYPVYRMSAGFGGDGHQSPSRFLSDIPRALLEEWNLAQSRMADPF